MRARSRRLSLIPMWLPQAWIPRTSQILFCIVCVYSVVIKGGSDSNLKILMAGRHSPDHALRVEWRVIESGPLNKTEHQVHILDRLTGSTLAQVHACCVGYDTLCATSPTALDIPESGSSHTFD